ncbi:helix-turn-helix transcriptional regulator [Halodesulfovibrio aestuarii]|uniref:Transcriptional regulator n=1 Tax=Halodesulfovibrio aestuarii TaxID=126333 RepID=A0ABV4JYC2_9BACT
MPQECRSQKTVERYIPLVKFLGVFLGNKCEVVLHDAVIKEKSVLAIANGHISGRTVGAPLTDLALQFVVTEKYKESDWVMGYKTQSSTGVPLHSATFFIREDDGSLAGMLCLNFEVSDILQAKELLAKFIDAVGFCDTSHLHSDENEMTNSNVETFTDNIEELTEGIIRSVVQHSLVAPERMTTAEKMEIMQTLQDRGVFLLKGSVALVAEVLAASEATIYRYLNKL